MKLSKVEWCVLALAGLLLAFTAGYFTGSKNAGNVSLMGVTVQTEALTEATVSDETEQTGQAEQTEQTEQTNSESPDTSNSSETEAEPDALEPAASEERDAAQTDSGMESGMLNVNTATAEELTALPGIGEALAARIVAYREENGPFQSVQELTNVSGIGEGKLANILDYITVGE